MLHTTRCSIKHVTFLQSTQSQIILANNSYLSQLTLMNFWRRKRFESNILKFYSSRKERIRWNWKGGFGGSGVRQQSQLYDHEFESCPCNWYWLLNFVWELYVNSLPKDVGFLRVTIVSPYQNASFHSCFTSTILSASLVKGWYCF